MTKEIEQELKNLVKLFVDTDKRLHPKPPEIYYKEILVSSKDMNDTIISEAINACKEDKSWETKHISYFIGIMKNKKIQYEKQKLLEAKTLSPIPSKIVWGKKEDENG